MPNMKKMRFPDGTVYPIGTDWDKVNEKPIIIPSNVIITITKEIIDDEEENEEEVYDISFSNKT